MLSVAGPKAEWSGMPAKAPGATSFRLAVVRCSLGGRKARICKHILTARQRLDEWLLGEEHIDHTRALRLVHELLLLARQAHKLAAVSVRLVQRATSIVPEAPAANHCDTASLDDTDYGS